MHSDTAPAAKYGTMTATGSGKDLPNLDVLRSVAVLLVLISHLWECLHVDHSPRFFGAFGVCLFFVHTALVLMWSLSRRPHVLDFYVRRIARIYPLSVLVVLITVAFQIKISPFPPSGDFFVYAHPSAKQILTHLLLVQNLFSGNIIVYPMWSLPIEVQMYLVFPIFFFLLRRRMKCWWLLGAWVLSLLASWPLFHGHAMNLLVTAPFFLSGMMAYVGFAKHRARLPAWGFIVLLSLLVWCGACAGNWQKACFPCLLLGLALPYFRQLPQNFFAKCCWYIARYSYGIYMLHPFAILLAFYVGRNLGIAMQMLILVTSLTVFAVAAFHWIEAPFMRWGARAAGRIPTSLPLNY